MQLEEIRTRPLGMILGFSVPSIAAMVLTSLVTVADGFFIGNWIGEEGLAAVNLGLPVIYLFLAVGLMVSIGGAAMAGMALGAKDLERCNHVFRHPNVKHKTQVFSTFLGDFQGRYFTPPRWGCFYFRVIS